RKVRDSERGRVKAEARVEELTARGLGMMEEGDVKEEEEELWFGGGCNVKKAIVSTVPNDEVVPVGIGGDKGGGIGSRESFVEGKDGVLEKKRKNIVCGLSSGGRENKRQRRLLYGGGGDHKVGQEGFGDSALCLRNDHKSGGSGNGNGAAGDCGNNMCLDLLQFSNCQSPETGSGKGTSPVSKYIEEIVDTDDETSSCLILGVTQPAQVVDDSFSCQGLTNMESAVERREGTSLANVGVSIERRGDIGNGNSCGHDIPAARTLEMIKQELSILGGEGDVTPASNCLVLRHQSRQDKQIPKPGSEKEDSSPLSSDAGDTSSSSSSSSGTEDDD
ncbi:hypothetical protein Tsubulata_005825, partial [Turnera subulata]